MKVVFKRTWRKCCKCIRTPFLVGANVVGCWLIGTHGMCSFFCIFGGRVQVTWIWHGMFPWSPALK